LGLIQQIHNQVSVGGTFTLIVCVSRSHSRLKRNTNFGRRIAGWYL